MEKDIKEDIKPINTEEIFNTVQLFVNLLNTIIQDYNISHDFISDVDKEQQDLVHDIEFSTFGASDGYKKAKNLQILRNKRRSVKNTLEIITPLHEYIKTHPSLQIDLYKILTKCKKIKSSQEVRVYTPRIRKDLAFKHVQQ